MAIGEQSAATADDGGGRRRRALCPSPWTRSCRGAWELGFPPPTMSPSARLAAPRLAAHPRTGTSPINALPWRPRRRPPLQPRFSWVKPQFANEDTAVKMENHQRIQYSFSSKVIFLGGLRLCWSQHC
uniref:Uncharacterized protein n=1 Tax=Oryza nivara TaxID=4536 RepID=A0A0E0H5Q6_ORYNI